MRRASHGRLTRRLPFPVDPDYVERELAKNLLYGLGFDATLLAWLPPRQMQKNRRTMMLLLSKHYRVPPSYWEDKPVTELNEWFLESIELSREQRSSLEDAIEDG